VAPTESKTQRASNLFMRPSSFVAIAKIARLLSYPLQPSRHVPLSVFGEVE
jgi:hypothetical protein